MHQCRMAMYVSLQDENKVPVLQAMAHPPNKQIMQPCTQGLSTHKQKLLQATESWAGSGNEAMNSVASSDVYLQQSATKNQKSCDDQPKQPHKDSEKMVSLTCKTSLQTFKCLYSLLCRILFMDAKHCLEWEELQMECSKLTFQTGRYVLSWWIARTR